MQSWGFSHKQMEQKLLLIPQVNSCGIFFGFAGIWTDPQNDNYDKIRYQTFLWLYQDIHSHFHISFIPCKL